MPAPVASTVQPARRGTPEFQPVENMEAGPCRGLTGYSGSDSAGPDCQGPRRDHLPDVVVIWDTDEKITTELQMEHHGVIRAPAAGCQLRPFYSGNHAPRAFAIAAGPDVPQGLVQSGRSILDLAPTILGEFGIEPPEQMQGEILRELRASGEGATSAGG